MSRAILSVNSGSSTIKFALYEVVTGGVGPALLSGAVEGLQPGGMPEMSCRYGRESWKNPLPQAAGGADRFALALEALQLCLQQHSDATVIAVAHRIVHGGERFSDSVVIDADGLSYLRSLHHLAPLHQPHNLDGVEAFARAFPQVPQIACFDTGFHSHMPARERHFALPAAVTASGIRRYGFHGLSYRFVSSRLFQLSQRASQRVLMAHLGNGASICAMQDGRSCATTMGFSALDGLMMGSRCGALDPGVLLHMLQDGWDAARIEHTLYKQSGLLGVSGISADMRTLRASDAPTAAAAIEMFSYRVTREAGALVAVLNGLDLIAFTGGIGEHDAQLRSDVVAGLAYLGLQIDPAKNREATGDQVLAIHAENSSAEIWVIPTDEGRVAAMDAASLLGFPQQLVS